MLILRPAAPADLDPLCALAEQLDSMNLPSDRAFLRDRIELSRRSFDRSSRDWRSGVYVFMLEDTEARRVVGTSAIIAKHGTPDVRHYWLEVSTEERRCDSLGKRFVHRRLRLRSTDDGPTEIGGLILDPDYRRHPRKCGKALSVVRFAYMSMHPERFERELIAEMLSPFEEPGRSLLWDAFGARFTGLSFREADRLAARDKQFIEDLFPQDPVYVTLFPEPVQRVIGLPGETAKAAVRILEKVGFHPLNQVDPFDGGPYYGAARDAVSSVNARRELVLPGLPAGDELEGEGPLALLSAEGKQGFRATVVRLSEEGVPAVSRSSREALGVQTGDRVTITPLP